jgi:Ca2+/H+ antiporter
MNKFVVSSVLLNAWGVVGMMLMMSVSVFYFMRKKEQEFNKQNDATVSMTTLSIMRWL